MTVDIQDETREARLLAELQHRVRNTLAMTRSIARRSAETSVSLEDYVAHLDGRLAALARVQNAAIRDPLAGIELGLLVSDEITSAGFGRSGQIQVEGPPLCLHPRAAETFALAIHELTTNAIKFGALSTSEGALSVVWRIEEGVADPSRLAFEWIESGARHSKDQEAKEGFGTLVLREMLKHNLGAQVEVADSSRGFSCHIGLPLVERVLPATI